ncbi:hypothetical protein CP985_14135 [Malaciobacter mytili LMG 24559]|uniref:HTH cro/C1-type domain-containing protein n=1 Tax=Malaciobacter mytili LMG 24559 TaxID=1032238 RepID=A0AAX2ABF8_9BACT|nr:helix-turn-helix domain-containing protein [Malaciobacter mytili]AXH16476.1 hypothetical protein AMYT_a0178 [Malaciobacter mytili LMG 24559]RXK12886.1 hypothetical protein CP985_14135 [Malaciobacter mytili LMG 24559]
MIELMTPLDIMEEFTDMIESERIKKGKTQEDLYLAAGMTQRTYANFIKKKDTKFSNIVNLLIALDLTSKLDMLIKQESYASLDEIREKNNKITRKRVRKNGVDK